MVILVNLSCSVLAGKVSYSKSSEFVNLHTVLKKTIEKNGFGKGKKGGKEGKGGTCVTSSSCKAVREKLYTQFNIISEKTGRNHESFRWGCCLTMGTSFLCRTRNSGKCQIKCYTSWVSGNRVEPSPWTREMCGLLKKAEIKLYVLLVKKLT